ncbi:MAG: DUF2029 domain-containing protein [Lachnospiraceae bacterium]|nr:DUF2029 domain-containing protein [Lachnospiraceae bacterium]
MKDYTSSLWGNKGVRITVIALLAAMAAVSLIQGIRNAAEFSQDFQWDAVKAFTMRINPYDESLDPSGVLDAYGFEDVYLQMEANQFPSLLVLLIPYTFLAPLTARYIWIVSNLVFTAGIIVLLGKTFLKTAKRDVFAAFMLLMIAGTPYRNQLGVGQHSLFAFFFFLLAVWFDEKEDRRVSFAGTVVCLFICYFKYTLTVPLCLYFIYKRRYARIAVSVLLHIMLTVISAWWLNDSVINMIIKPLKVSGALAGEGCLDFGVVLNGSKAAYVLAFAVLAVLFVLAFRLGENNENDYISVLTLWSLIITYHRIYDFFIIVIVLAFFLTKERSIYYKAGYGAVLAAVFFVLRLFSESPGSKLATGILYYVFTLAVTTTVIKEGVKSKTECKGAV